MEGVTVGAMILGARKAKGLTQEQLAGRIGISRAQIANVEVGKSDMPMKMLRRFADALECKARDLIPF